MARSEEDRLVLSSRYIHTGNSGVTLTVRRDLVRPDRAELEMENGAFGAFHTNFLVRGNDFSGMTAIQLRDLGLMFLDAADALDNDCRTPLKGGAGYSSLLGKNRTDIVPEGGGRRNPPDSLRRYIPGELEGIALDPDLDFTAFAKTYHEQESKKDMGVYEGENGLKGLTLSPTQKQQRKQKELEKREARVREDYIRKTGWDYLLAKRLLDVVRPFYEKTRRAFEIHDSVKFTMPVDEEDSELKG